MTPDEINQIVERVLSIYALDKSDIFHHVAPHKLERKRCQLLLKQAILSGELVPRENLLTTVDIHELIENTIHEKGLVIRKINDGEVSTGKVIAQVIIQAQQKKIKGELCWSCNEREPMNGYGQCCACKDNQ